MSQNNVPSARLFGGINLQAVADHPPHPAGRRHAAALARVEVGEFDEVRRGFGDLALHHVRPRFDRYSSFLNFG